MFKIKDKATLRDPDNYITPTYASRSVDISVPKYELPQEGISAPVAYNLVRDELITS